MEQRNPASFIYILLVVLLALVVDIAQLILDFIPLVGWAINVVIDIFFGIVFYALLNAIGIKTRGFKKRAAFLVGLVANAIPVVGDIALWTFDILIIVWLDARERRQTEKMVAEQDQQPQNMTSGQALRMRTARNIQNPNRPQTQTRIPLQNPRTITPNRVSKRV